MIDPRRTQVAMLPILNAVAGHMIHEAAPLRVINVEDTEQMIAEASDHCGIDADVIERELGLWASGELFDFSGFVAANFEQCEVNVEALNFLRTLEATIAEAV